MDKKFRVPRVWSNTELRKFASFFKGSVVNVSGWTDEDKEGNYYREYFSNASEYSITNYKEEEKGLQGFKNEIFLDLTAPLSSKLQGAFDTVFNHTTLEHIFECRLAFQNICKISRDVVIIVVPFLQQVHGKGYKDYWRFTPHSIKDMYEENGLKLRYCSANGSDKASIYLFAIGYRDAKWDKLIPDRFDLALDESQPLYSNGYQNIIGGNVITQ